MDVKWTYTLYILMALSRQQKSYNFFSSELMFYIILLFVNFLEGFIKRLIIECSYTANGLNHNIYTIIKALILYML